MAKLLLIVATLLVIYNVQESTASTGSFTLLEINRFNNRNHTQNHRFQGTKEVQGFSDGSNLEMVKKFRVCNFSMFCARIYDTFVDSRQKENNRPKISRNCKDCRMYS